MTEDLLNELLDSPDPAAFASKHKLACRSLPIIFSSCSMSAA